MFEESVLPLVTTFQPRDEREACLCIYFHKLLLTVRGLSFLSQPDLFQLTLAATRNLLEVLVDRVHVAHHEPADVVERIEAWENSAKLKAAQEGVAYLAHDPQPDQVLRDQLLDFIARKEADIRAARRHFWPPSGKHPQRWTGRNLLEDCRAADRLDPFGLERFYQLEYRQMNWNIHGSAFAGLRGFDLAGLELIYARSQTTSGKFAQKATQIILEQLGLLKVVEPQLVALADDFGAIVGAGG